MFIDAILQYFHKYHPYYSLHTRSLLAPYACVSIKLIDCILLSSLTLNAILLTSLVNTLRVLLLNLYCDHNTNLFLCMNSL